MAWGTSSWGTSPWGRSARLSLSRAVAVSTRSIRVYFAGTPAAASRVATHDALNPASYTITRLDTGATLTALGVDRLDASTFDVLLLVALGPHGAQHRIACDVVASSGALVAAPRSALFDGVGQVVAAPPRAQHIVRDLVPTEAGAGLTMQGGDYALAGGITMRKRLYLRRLVSSPTDFFHLLGRNYGVGLRDKTPVRAGDVPGLQRAIELQIAREPDVGACRAQVVAGPGNLLRIAIAVDDRTTGDTHTIGVTLSDAVEL